MASVSYSVSGQTVTLTPTVTFAPDKVSYGFVANALYEIAFSNPNSGVSVKSVTGDVLGNPNVTFFFRTPDKGFDLNPGYPAVHAYIVDDPTAVTLPATIVDADGDGDLLPETLAFYANEVQVQPLNAVPVPIQIPVGPVRDILFIFDDAVQPTTAVNLVDESSPAIKVSINTVPLPNFQPKGIPAQFSFIHQQTDLTIVRWHPTAVAYPPGSFLLIDVAPTVQDLAGNSKGAGAPDLVSALHVVDVADATVYALSEPFNNGSQEDTSSTSAEWATEFPGQLGPVLGGGTGEEGPLIIDPATTATSLADTVLPLGAVIDIPGKTVELPTVEEVASGVFEPRVYNLTTLELPVGWKIGVLFDRDKDGTLDPDEYLVQSPGHPLDGLGAPLSLRCSGNVNLLGIIDVRGIDAEVLVRPETALDPLYAAYQAQGGPTTTALQASGDGGRGGDVLLLGTGGTLPILLESPPASPAYQPSDGKLTGASGRSSVLTATTLLDTGANFTQLDTVHGTGDPALTALVAEGELLLQPNLGVGSSLLGNSGTANQTIDENHPTFVVDSVSVTGGQTTYTVSSDPGDPTLTQPSKNIGAAAIAAAGDCYLIGRLRGGNGGDVTALDRGGIGAQPYVVVNEGSLGISTTSGGGGGGGSIAPGSAGESDGPASDPLVNQRGTSGGIALDDSPGAPGGSGTIVGVGRVIDGTHIDLVSQSSGKPLSSLTAGELSGCLILPDALEDGWLFELSSFDGVTFTIEPVQLDAIQIGLTDGPGPDGPALTPGTDYTFRIIPSLDIGGGGGGGAGVSVTGTVNSAATVLPTFAPGAGGGAGGGSAALESARDMTIGPAGGVLATGGAGAIVFDVQTKFAGGGGGGGGNAVIRAGRSLTVFQGATISVQGGEGGGLASFGKGGSGGAGYIRIESFDDDLVPENLANVTFPQVDESNFGRLLGVPQGIGQSLFFETGVLNPAWTDLTVDYVADTNDDDIPEAFTWSVDDTGIDPGVQGFDDPPFRIGFNTAPFGPTGFIDDAQASDSFYPAADLFSARTGLAWDSSSDVVLYAVGEGCSQIHRLDPATLATVASGPPAILLPTIPSVGEAKLNVVSLAVDQINAEIFLLERVTRRVHVIDLATAAFKRTITLPLDLQGAMTYLPAPLDLLVFADDTSDRLVTFAPRDAAAALPQTTDYAPLLPVSQFIVSRDGVPFDIQLVGMAWDNAAQKLWCSDSNQGLLFEVNFASGFEGTSVTGSERLSKLTSGGDGVLPSGIAFKPGSLYLVHATDVADTRIQALPPASVSLTGADLALSTFGVLLPEGARSIADGDVFLRFRISIDGLHDVDGVSFRNVRIDAIDLTYANEAF